MRIFLAALFLLGVVSTQAQFSRSVAFRGSAVPKAPTGGGGGCGTSIASGNINNELFTNTPGAGWTSAGSTIAFGQTLPTSPSIPCQLPSTGLHATWSGTSTPYAQYDRGTFDCSHTNFTRFYFYVNSTSMSPNGGNFFQIAGGDETVVTFGNCYQIQVMAKTSTTDLAIFTQFAGGVTSATNSITAGHWYRYEVQYKNSGACAVKLFDASNSQIGTTWTGTSANNKCFRSFVVGIPSHNNTTGADVYITGVGISNTGFLGQ